MLVINKQPLDLSAHFQEYLDELITKSYQFYHHASMIIDDDDYWNDYFGCDDSDWANEIDSCRQYLSKDKNKDEKRHKRSRISDYEDDDDYDEDNDFYFKSIDKYNKEIEDAENDELNERINEQKTIIFYPNVLEDEMYDEYTSMSALEDGIEHLNVSYTNDSAFVMMKHNLVYCTIVKTSERDKIAENVCVAAPTYNELLDKVEAMIDIQNKQ